MQQKVLRPHIDMAAKLTSDLKLLEAQVRLHNQESGLLWRICMRGSYLDRVHKVPRSYRYELARQTTDKRILTSLSVR